VLNEEFLDVITMPLRDAAGNFNLHYLLRLHRPSDFAIEEATTKSFTTWLSRHAFMAGQEADLQRREECFQYLDAAEVDRIKHSLFGYEGWLPLVPASTRLIFC